MTDKQVNDKQAAANDDGLDIFEEFAVVDDAIYVAYKNDVEFLIAREGNPKYRRRLGYLYEKNKRALDGKGEVAEAKSNEVMATVMAETILLGWKGTVRLKGEVLPYSKENAAKLLAVQPFREWVSKQAKDEYAYKAVKDEEDTENL